MFNSSRAKTGGGLDRQFGAHPSKATDKFTVRNFRSKCLRELKKIEEAWPELYYGLARGVLIVEPSALSIPSLTQ